MCLDVEMIKGKMKEIVGDKVDNLYLEEIFLIFINEKKYFLFGVFVFQYYVVFKGIYFLEIILLVVGIEFLILVFDIFDDIEDEDNFNKVWM